MQQRLGLRILERGGGFLRLMQMVGIKDDVLGLPRGAL